MYDCLNARCSDGSITDALRAVAHVRESLAQKLLYSNWMSDEKNRDLISLDVSFDSDAHRSVESSDALGNDGTFWSHLTAVRAATASLNCSEAGLHTEGELERAIYYVRAVVDLLRQQGESHSVELRAAATFSI